MCELNNCFYLIIFDTTILILYWKRYIHIVSIIVLNIKIRQYNIKINLVISCNLSPDTSVFLFLPTLARSFVYHLLLCVRSLRAVLCLYTRGEQSGSSLFREIKFLLLGPRARGPNECTNLCAAVFRRPWDVFFTLLDFLILLGSVIMYFSY